jgi:hypothetical protein
MELGQVHHYCVCQDTVGWSLGKFITIVFARICCEIVMVNGGWVGHLNCIKKIPDEIFHFKQQGWSQTTGVRPTRLQRPRARSCCRPNQTEDLVCRVPFLQDWMVHKANSLGRASKVQRSPNRCLEMMVEQHQQ